MADEIKEKEEPKQPSTRVIELLEQQNKLIGALNQTLSTYLQQIARDTEVCKVYLGKLVKMGPPEVIVNQGPSGQSQSGPFPSTPGGPGKAIPGGE